MMVCHCGSPAELGGCNGLAEVCLFCFELWQAAGEPVLCPCDTVQDEFTNLPGSPSARPGVENARGADAPSLVALPPGLGGGELAGRFFSPRRRAVRHSARRHNPLFSPASCNVLATVSGASAMAPKGGVS